MKANMGKRDKFIRIGVALVLAVLVALEIITGTLAFVALGVGIVFLLTSFMSFCPLYTLLGINTCKKQTNE
ncbi:hypothetical protein FSS13T_27110 [Flavobacterium saliperosum S13]|uniref:Inner membrane protein YgaP-like transmembrane domain-containing protein n=2 Tax=Flavobacterium saliperosum TaxID=329186 RepID=A0A1G4W581_9FLAO|nr:DUF2892 domain-containing protein [Flavobacterium saliperosum]ESU21552.1 hypothetical protein FSS13T_27110 [Flavobacterium saliperosum S13]SCX16983.1 Protein of unknown function [Flavobacterium saliperosum]